MMRVRRRLDSVMVREIEDDLIVLDVEADKVHQLNQTAKFIWQHCDEALTPEAIADRLAAQYDVDAAVALKDVREMMERLHALNLVVTE